MAEVSTYLNFAGNTEAAFTFYRSVFGTDFQGDIVRVGDVPPEEGQPPLRDEDKQLVMNVTLPILGDHILMGTDATESMGFTLHQGNNVYICLHPDSREEADALFESLSARGQIEMPMADMFWGDYFGSFIDQFGVGWMIAYEIKS